MFRKLLSKLPKTGSAPSASIAAGRRIYAIGDIHGRDDLLEQLLDQIAADDAGRPPAETTLIFLGDLVDRGPSSAQVVERLLRLQATRSNVHFLLGNHEEVFLLALSGDLEALRFFTRIGGRETILSYGLTPSEYDSLDYLELMEAFQARVPQAHIDFITGFEDLIEIGDYAFVHAGVQPTVPLAEQKTSDLRWIRNEFVNFRGNFERIIVHGHTIAENVEWRSNRIGIDTGAFASGRLTALGLEGVEQWLVQT